MVRVGVKSGKVGADRRIDTPPQKSDGFDRLGKQVRLGLGAAADALGHGLPLPGLDGAQIRRQGAVEGAHAFGVEG